jgi:hypothetical protein
LSLVNTVTFEFSGEGISAVGLFFPFFYAFFIKASLSSFEGIFPSFFSAISLILSPDSILPFDFGVSTFLPILLFTAFDNRIKTEKKNDYLLRLPILKQIQQ